jgi:glycosyltransferase involved in cell wall biosynthesis
MRALIGLGHDVALVTRERPVAEAIAGLDLLQHHVLPPSESEREGVEIPSARTGLRERYRSYYGVDQAGITGVAALAAEHRVDAVVAVGFDGPPYLSRIHGPLRIWYAGDEGAWHHISMLRWNEPGGWWRHCREAAIKGLYERVHGSLFDRVWVVSSSDHRAMRHVLGHDRVRIIPNGVDANWYQPQASPEWPRSCLFWGRLDFGPNLQALHWFCRWVWPRVRGAVPDARFRICGFQPTSTALDLAGAEGIDLVPNLPDLREEIVRHQVVVLPFLGGGGIKNKLLEAAALGRPILATPQATNGLRGNGRLPLVVERGARRWATRLRELWENPTYRQWLGESARRWVVTEHSWEGAARAALAGLPRSVSASHPDAVRIALDCSMGRS